MGERKMLPKQMNVDKVDNDIFPFTTCMRVCAGCGVCACVCAEHVLLRCVIIECVARENVCISEIPLAQN